MWHGGGLDKAGRTRGFQLWIALPPELELGPTISTTRAPDEGIERRFGAVLPAAMGPHRAPSRPPHRSINSRYA